MAKRAASLLRGRNEGDEFLLWVGGRHAQGILDGAPALYWPEVWGARALMSAWDDAATDAVLGGLRNQAWRVREMCLKVCAERRLDVGNAVQRLTTDPVARVRSAAARALAATGDGAQAEALTAMLKDPDKEVRRTAQQSLAALSAGGHPTAEPTIHRPDPHLLENLGLQRRLAVAQRAYAVARGLARLHA